MQCKRNKHGDNMGVHDDRDGEGNGNKAVPRRFSHPRSKHSSLREEMIRNCVMKLTRAGESEDPSPFLLSTTVYGVLYQVGYVSSRYWKCISSMCWRLAFPAGPGEWFTLTQMLAPAHTPRAPQSLRWKGRGGAGGLNHKYLASLLVQHPIPSQSHPILWETARQLKPVEAAGPEGQS